MGGGGGSGECGGFRSIMIPSRYGRSEALTCTCKGVTSINISMLEGMDFGSSPALLPSNG